MTNTHYLKDGRHFIVNPDVEENPHEARRVKKLFLTTLNSTDLATDKLWTVENIRALATGLVPTMDGKKRATKKQLVERLQSYIHEEKTLMTVAAQDILNNLKECNYSPEALLEMLGRLHGTALVDEVEKSIMLGGFADTTIVKTLMPDVVKTINQHYQGTDKGFVVTELRRKFNRINKQVNEASHAQVVVQSNNRKPIKFEKLERFINKLTLDISKLSWKELSVCLAFATGRRMAEVHGAGTSFSICDKPGFLTFKGQLKTKGRGELEAYDIPSLLEPELVLRMHEKLKMLGKADYMPEDVNRMLSKELSTRLTPELQEMYQKVGIKSYKDLRDIYASKIAEQRPVHMTETVFIAKYLGHGENDLSTAQTYQKTYLDYSD